MLYDAVIKIKLPGNNPDDACKRLTKAVPHWPFELVDITPAEVQPPRLVGEINIVMPLPGVENGR